MSGKDDTQKHAALERNSSFELLRIICIYGIISMHMFGPYVGNATGIGRVYGCMICSVFNMGVSLFMFISGYFGVTFSVGKLIRLLAIIIFYCLTSTVCKYIMGGGISIKEITEDFLAIFRNRYWYATVYIIMFLISDIINRTLISLDKADFNRLIFVLFLFFVLSPTILRTEILGDAGKGIVNMFLVYIVGRYIKIYKIRMTILKSSCLATLIIGSLFAITLLMSFRKDCGISARLCHDNSVFIFFGSFFTFLAFRELEFRSKIINRLAKAVFATYLFEGTARGIITRIYNWQPIKACNEVYFLLVPILVILLVFALESMRLLFFSRSENKIAAALS